MSPSQKRDNFDFSNGRVDRWDHPGTDGFFLPILKIVELAPRMLIGMDQPAVSRAYYQLRRFYSSHFEHSWFQILMEDISMDPLVVKDVRDFFLLTESWQLNVDRIAKGLKDLDAFLSAIRQYLLPSLREKLRISYLRPDTVIRDKDQFTIRTLISQAVPINVKRLELLTKDLKTSFESACLSGTFTLPNPALAPLAISSTA